ncbi:MAG: hypothetical protein KOO60_10875 [Gemmatimonadales bacterium]|nr:hypothetical protein [Gemmatimonadales bacterium]
MKKNTVMAVIVVALGLTLSYISTGVTVGWKVVIVGIFAFCAITIASFTGEV